ncbi:MULTISPECIES: DUF4345 domain-containing protein [unclassified Nocardioides]|uniref:DUF4345 domain-containing protein n=1 Tax=unclassified Nocardioides TaxID=2615069 RepID=UPI003608B657
MSTLTVLGRITGWTCIGIGAMQIVSGVRFEPGIDGNATVDSHLRFMGAIFAGYGHQWLQASSGDEADLTRMRLLAGCLAVGGAARLGTRVTLGRPHRFHDLLTATELAAPVIVEVVARRS